MKSQKPRRAHRLVLLTLGALAVWYPLPAAAHCDGLDGPVVTAAREALRSGHVEQVLIWVPKMAEAEVRKAFTQTLTVRVLSSEARDLADRHFFETVVRVHRAGEGVGFGGLKPAGRDLGPAIPAADRALQTGNLEPLLKLLSDAVRASGREHFQQTARLKRYDRRDVEAGRKYVNAYVVFIHLVERMYEAAHQPIVGHHIEPPAHAAD
jgi:hypothetical protein